jgi:membrane protein YdbS with pleckstrin-like domain
MAWWRKVIYLLLFFALHVSFLVVRYFFDGFQFWMVLICVFLAFALVVILVDEELAN